MKFYETMKIHKKKIQPSVRRLEVQSLKQHLIPKKCKHYCSPTDFVLPMSYLDNTYV
jgi:hypothetical protein